VVNLKIQLELVLDGLQWWFSYISLSSISHQLSLFFSSTMIPVAGYSIQLTATSVSATLDFSLLIITLNHFRLYFLDNKIKKIII
jgi:hypothetical protein